MSAPTYQTASIACPNCQHRFTTPVLTIIDVDQNPQLKSLFLSGQINVAVCPQCGQGGELATPLVYHDSEKELLLTLVPAEMGLSDLEQQRIIGDLTNRVISALPPEKRKGYLLRPRTFMRRETMIEAILEADGITPEMLEAQRARADLLERLVSTTSEEARRAIAQANDAQIDYEFLHLLSLNLDLAEARGHADAAQQLKTLRQQLLDWTTIGQEATRQGEAIRSLGPEVSREELLDKVVAAALEGQDSIVQALVAVARPVIDYAFYQQLAARIEVAEQAGDAEQAKTLKQLRETILELTTQLDAEYRQAALEAGELLEQILDSEDLEQAVRDNVQGIDETFLDVLGASMETAREAGQEEDIEKLRRVAAAIGKLVEESQPAELQFINELMQADYPDGTQALLVENRDQVDEVFLELMDIISADLAQRGQEEAARQMAKIREQAATL